MEWHELAVNGMSTSYETRGVDAKGKKRETQVLGTFYETRNTQKMKYDKLNNIYENSDWRIGKSIPHTYWITIYLCS